MEFQSGPDAPIKTSAHNCFAAPLKVMLLSTIKELVKPFYMVFTVNR
jgi:hypothetical protein